MKDSKGKIQSEQRLKRRVDELFSIVDVLVLICEFLEDSELLSFLMIRKSTYQLLSKSKIIEVRLLRYELKNAETILEEYLPQERTTVKKSSKPKDPFQSLFQDRYIPRPHTNLYPMLDAHVLTYKINEYISNGLKLLQRTDKIEEMGITSPPETNNTIKPINNFNGALRISRLNELLSKSKRHTTYSGSNDMYYKGLVQSLSKSEDERKKIESALKSNFDINDKAAPSLLSILEPKRSSSEDKKAQEKFTTVEKGTTSFWKDLYQNYIVIPLSAPRYNVKHL